MPKRSSSACAMCVDEAVVVAIVAVAHQMRGQGDLAARPATRCAGGAPPPRRAARPGTHAPATGRCRAAPRPSRQLKLSRSRPNALHATTTPISSAVAGSSQVQPSHHMPSACEHRRQRYRGIGHQVQEGAAAVEVVRVAVAHQPRRAQVDRDADAAATITRQGGDLRRRAEAADRLPAQCAGKAHQQQRIGQRRQQRGAAPAVGVAAVGGRWASTAAAQARPRPSTSPRLCSASDSSASELVAKP